MLDPFVSKVHNQRMNSMQLLGFSKEFDTVPCKTIPENLMHAALEISISI